MPDEAQPPPMRSLDEIICDYERAEITVVWIHERPPTNVHTIVFAVCEFCPAEQPRVAIGDATRDLARAALDDGITVYAKRWFVTPREALFFFRGAGPARVLMSDGKRLDFKVLGTLEDEPPNEVPVLLDDAHAFRNVFPTRPAGLRLVSKLGIGHAGVANLEQTHGARARDELRKFIIDQVGVDVIRFDEHFGSLHAAFPNAILRSFEYRIVPHVPALAVTALTRLGATIAGCVLRLTDHRPQGIGFDLEVPLAQTHALVPIPCDVDELEARVMNPHGELIFRRRGHFLREIALAIEVGGGAQRRIADARSPGVVHTIPIQSGPEHAQRSVVGTAPTARGPFLVRTADHQRLAKSPDESLRIFPRGSDDKARAFVRELIGNASTRCVICDPYLGPRDAYEYATFVRRSRLPIWLLGSTERSRRRIDRVWPATFAGNGQLVLSEPTAGEQLQQQLTALMAQDASLNITCRLLRGKKSPIHDRFIVVDDTAYALGSSLNEYGSRLTTCIRLSRSTELLAVLNSYWNDDKLTVALSDWVARTEPEDE